VLSVERCARRWPAAFRRAFAQKPSALTLKLLLVYVCRMKLDVFIPCIKLA
jgi:hypothetical protein